MWAGKIKASTGHLKLWPKVSSLVICFHDEAWSTLLYTVHSVLSTTPACHTCLVFTPARLPEDRSEYVSRLRTVCVWFTAPGAWALESAAQWVLPRQQGRSWCSWVPGLALWLPERFARTPPGKSWTEQVLFTFILKEWCEASNVPMPAHKI